MKINSSFITCSEPFSITSHFPKSRQEQDLDITTHSTTRMKSNEDMTSAAYKNVRESFEDIS